MTTIPHHLDAAAFQSVDSQFAANLRPSLEGVVTSANQDFRLLEASTTPVQVERRINETIGAIRHDLAAIRDDLLARRRHLSKELKTAITAAIKDCRDEALIPDEATIARERNNPPYHEDRLLYFLFTLRNLNRQMSNLLEGITPAVNREVADLSGAVLNVLLTTGHLSKLTRATSAKDLGDWLDANHSSLGTALHRFSESGVLNRQLIVNLAREPLDRLRPDRAITGLPRPLVRAIATNAVVDALPTNPADLDNWTGQPRWRRQCRRVLRRARALGETTLRRIQRRHPNPELVIHRYLRQYQLKTVAAMEEPLWTGMPNVHAQLASGVWEVILQLLEGDDEDLKQFYRQHATKIWSDEMAHASQQANVRAKWRALVTDINTIANPTGTPVQPA
jgi:hypothetical protein